MKITIEIDLPEVEDIQSIQQQLDTLHKQYQATVQLDNVEPSQMLQAFIQEAQGIEAPHERGHLFIQNLYRETYLSELSTRIISKRAFMADSVRELLKELNKQHVRGSTTLQLAAKKVTDVFDISLTNRIQAKAKADADKLFNETLA